MIYTVDAIIKHNGKLVLIERKHFPLGLALPGGKIDPGETPEQAVIREVKEELNVDVTTRKKLATMLLQEEILEESMQQRFFFATLKEN